MHKVVLECKNEAALNRVANSLTDSGIDHYKWIEQPEGIVTCLATIPIEKNDESALIFKKCQLYGGFFHSQ